MKYYSNCLIEAIKAKIKHGKEIKILHVKSKDGLHHFMWHNLEDNNIYDFQQLDVAKNWCNIIWFCGKIRIRPYEIYEKWIKTGKW